MEISPGLGELVAGVCGDGCVGWLRTERVGPGGPPEPGAALGWPPLGAWVPARLRRWRWHCLAKRGREGEIALPHRLPLIDIGKFIACERSW